MFIFFFLSFIFVDKVQAQCADLSGTYLLPGGYSDAKCVRTGRYQGNGERVHPTLPLLEPAKYPPNKRIVDFESAYDGSGTSFVSFADLILEIQQNDCESATVKTHSFRRGSDPLGLNTIKNDIQYHLEIQKSNLPQGRKFVTDPSGWSILDPKKNSNCDEYGTPADGHIPGFCPRENVWKFEKNRNDDLVLTLIGPYGFEFECQFVSTKNFPEDYQDKTKLFKTDALTIPRLPLSLRPQGYPFRAGAWIAENAFQPDSLTTKDGFVLDDAYNLNVSVPAKMTDSLWVTHWDAQFPQLINIEDSFGQTVLQIPFLFPAASRPSNPFEYVSPQSDRIDLSSAIQNGTLKPFQTYVARVYGSAVNKQKTAPISISNDNFTLNFELPYPKPDAPLYQIAKAAKNEFKTSGQKLTVRQLLPNAYLETVNGHEYSTQWSTDSTVFGVIAVPRSQFTRNPRRELLLVQAGTGANQKCVENVITVGSESELDINRAFDVKSGKFECPSGYTEDRIYANPVPEAMISFREDQGELKECQVSGRVFKPPNFGKTEYVFKRSEFDRSVSANGKYRFALATDSSGYYFASDFNVDGQPIHQDPYYSLYSLDSKEIGYARAFTIEK